MKALDPPARVMVVSDDADAAASILDRLKEDHPDSRAAVDVTAAVQAFDDFRPDVLLVAFDKLAEAEAYALRLHRLGQVVHEHRSVLLCHDEDAPAALELCRDGRFDDYVVFWPQALDASRLSMSVLQAARQHRAGSVRGPTHIELVAHVKKLAALQAAFDQHRAQAESQLGGHAFAPQQTLESRLGPHLVGLQTLGEKVRQTKPLVMVVDDDEFACKLTVRALDGSPYDLTFAHDGGAALALLRRTRPDLILMDVNLPDIDGVALTQKLKAAPHLADIPVLMLTGDARRQTLESSMTAGAAGFVVKPFTPRGLLDKLDRFLSTAP